MTDHVPSDEEIQSQKDNAAARAKVDKEQAEAAKAEADFIAKREKEASVE